MLPHSLLAVESMCEIYTTVQLWMASVCGSLSPAVATIFVFDFSGFFWGCQVLNQHVCQGPTH